MKHELRAEYADDERRDTVKSWHIVRGGETEAMCGHLLLPDAEARPDTDWGRTPEPMCHTCGALYLREVPQNR